MPVRDPRATQLRRMLGQRGAAALLRTASLLERALARDVAPARVSFAQYNVLRILRAAGGDGLSTMTLRARMIEPAAGITRLLDKLEAAGYVRRERADAGGDRRRVRCRITRAGTRLLAQCTPAVYDTADAAFETLSLAEQRRLVALLDAVRLALAEREEASDAETRSLGL